MRKVAIVFVMAVLLPSLGLAWLALRSLRDQQFLIERQQAASLQGLAGALAQRVNGILSDQRREFTRKVDDLLAERPASEAASTFDARLREAWPMTEVGFAVSLDGGGRVLSPSLFSDNAARSFRLENDRFLCNKEAVDIYWNPKGLPSEKDPVSSDKGSSSLEKAEDQFDKKSGGNSLSKFPSAKTGKSYAPEKEKGASSLETEFRTVVADSVEGSIARFLQNQLKVLFWYKPSPKLNVVFGAQVRLPRLVEQLRPAFEIGPALTNSIMVALLDDTDRPRLLSTAVSRRDWKHPFVSSDIGEVLPHWQIAVFLNDPGRLAHSASAVRWTITLMIGLLMVAIGAGSWLIVADVRRQLALSRQKTDFVSNVSHELKTPLTSIRMFSELLAEGRVSEESRRREYLGIISSETARLSRLINNVLDFARMERAEKKYSLETCDLRVLVRDTVESYRPQLEATGFAVQCELPSAEAPVRCDRDALAQVLVNLISNAEKYSRGTKEIIVRVRVSQTEAEVQVLDRGIGVPAGCEEKIFEQFFRAHDALSSGIQGSGLGLTLARQIVHAHKGTIAHSSRLDGGSCFTVRLPIDPATKVE